MRYYTETEDKFIRDNYLSQTLLQMGNHLGRAFGSISGRMKKLGLELPPDLKEQRKRIGIIAGWEKGRAFQFKKGQVAHNKGKKVSPEVYERSKHTFFQKGNLPHNTRYDGATRINVDGYIEVRVGLKIWKLKHRLVWEQHNGSITNGFNVVFKDQNRQNCQIDNLELISRRENMLRNTFRNYPEELQKTIQLKGVLKRTINQINKQQNNGIEQPGK